MSYKFSRKADEDIINVYIDGVRDYGVAQAEKYHARLEYVFQLLSDTPHLARQRDEITPPVRIHPHESHVIIYTLDEENNVLILRVRGGSEDWKNNPIK
jgi:toxin ParE1/3/4